MKIPKRTKVGGHWIKVDISTNEKTGDGNGTTFNLENRIWINKDMVTSKQWSVFFHEIVHILDWINNLNFTEMQVSTLSEGLFQVLVDNKMIAID